MFNKKDPLIDSVKNIMKENEVRREAERKLNEELGIASKKALPFEHHANYDALLEQKIAEALHPNQQKLDVHEPEKDELTAQDFKMLRAMGKKKPTTEETITQDAKNPIPKTAAERIKGDAETAPKFVNKPADQSKLTDADKSAMTDKVKEVMKEASYSAKEARAGKDIGKPGKMFKKIASDAAKRYGSEERGKKVAGAVLAKLRSKSMEEQVITQTDPITGQKSTVDYGATIDKKIQMMNKSSELDDATKKAQIRNLDRNKQHIKDLEDRGEKDWADWQKQKSKFTPPKENLGTRPEASKAFDEPTPDEERAKSAKDAESRRKNELAKAEQDLEQTRKDKAHSTKVKDLSDKIEREKAGEDTRGTFEKIKSSVKSAMGLDEKAPPGAKFERMVKHIKSKYAKDGLTKKEKSIAYATAWKAKNKEEMKEAVEAELRKNLGEKFDEIMEAQAEFVAKGATDPREKANLAADTPKPDVKANLAADTPKPDVKAKPDISASVQKSIEADNPGTSAPPERPAVAAPKPAAPKAAAPAPRPAAPAPRPAAPATKPSGPVGGPGAGEGEDSSSPLAALRQYQASKEAGNFDKPEASAPAAKPAAPRAAAPKPSTGGNVPLPPSRPAGLGTSRPSDMAAGRAAERSVPTPSSSGNMAAGRAAERSVPTPSSPKPPSMSMGPGGGIAPRGSAVTGTDTGSKFSNLVSKMNQPSTSTYSKPVSKMNQPSTSKMQKVGGGLQENLETTIRKMLKD